MESISRAAIVVGCLSLMGCANVTGHLERSMSESYFTSDVCTTVNEIVEVRPADVDALVLDVVEGLISTRVCSTGGAKDCRNEVAEALNALRLTYGDLISTSGDARRDLTAARADIDERFRALEAAVRHLRSDLRTAGFSARQQLAGETCRSESACVLTFGRLLAQVLETAQDRLADIQGRLDDLQDRLETVVLALGGEQRKLHEKQTAVLTSFLTLTRRLQASYDMAAQSAPQLKLRADLDDLAKKIALQQAGRFTIQILHKGTQSVDRVLDKVDDRIWAAFSLGWAWYEGDVRDVIAGQYAGFFDGGPSTGKVLRRNLGVAMVFAACEQLTSNIGDASAVDWRGSYLLHPLLSGSIVGLYCAVHIDTAHPCPRVDGQVLFKDVAFRSELLAWLQRNDNIVRAQSPDRKIVLQTVASLQPNLDNVHIEAIKLEQTKQAPKDSNETPAKPKAPVANELGRVLPDERFIEFVRPAPLDSPLKTNLRELSLRLRAETTRAVNNALK